MFCSFECCSLAASKASEGHESLALHDIYFLQGAILLGVKIII
jgi:hypothetical protein